MTSWRRLIGTFFVWFVAIASFAGTSAQANTIDAVEAARNKINISGRQRMLSQRMSAAACLAMSNIGGDARRQVALSARDDFERALTGLAAGDEGLGLPAETNADIIASLEVVRGTWGTIGPAVQQLVANDLHSVVVSQLLNGNVPLLTQSNAAVQEIVADYGSGVIDPQMAQTINNAGRQRMLSQKMMKEACLIAVGLSPDQNLAALAATMELFDTSLSELRAGNAEAGIAPPPSEKVAAQLEKVASLWEAYRSGLSQIQFEGPDNWRLLEELAVQSDEILAAMHKAVLLYVEDPA